MARDAQRSDRDLRARPGTRIAAVVSEFHHELTGAMWSSARAELVAAGVAEEDLFEARVPGAFELPLVARRFARRPDVAAVLCFNFLGDGLRDAVDPYSRPG